MYDLLLKGGTVVDPSAGLHGVHDIAVQDGKIARIAPTIPRAEASRVHEVAGKIVTPGLIDLHAHVFEGFTGNGVHPDLGGVYAGVTTLVDAGSSGCATFAGLPTAYHSPLPYGNHPLFAYLSDRPGDQPGYHCRK